MKKKDENNLVVCYYRLSTDKQALGIDAQKTAIKQYLSEHPELLVLDEFEDSGENAMSGKTSNREGFKAALRLCEDSGATLLAATMDRIGRGKFLYTMLGNDKVKFRALDVKSDSDLEMSIRIALACEEVKKISERTSKAKLAKSKILAKAKESYELGDMIEAQRFLDYAQRTSRRPLTLEQYAERGFRDNGIEGASESGRKRIAEARIKEADNDETNIRASNAIRIYLKQGGKRTYRAIATYLNEELHLKTRRGGCWTKDNPSAGWKPQSVKNLMERFGL